MRKSVIFTLLICFFLLNSTLGQTDSLSSCQVNKKRLKGVIISESVAYVSSLAGLYTLWYSDYRNSRFHFFNDNREWLYMDKIGHATTAYYLGKIGYESMYWAGVPSKKSAIYGGLLGLSYLTIVEVMDGFSEGWGASPGDLAADAFGSALFFGQQYFWKDQRMLLKFSYHNTRYAQYRPNTLGKNLPQRMLKDYNGQTYWLSINFNSFLKNKKSFLPKWLNLAIGYSADGMISSQANPLSAEGVQLPSFERKKQYLLSLDIDLTRIETRHKSLNLFFDIIGFIKVPFPAIELSQSSKPVYHFLYF